MAQDVLITPGSGIVEFKNDTVTDGTIQITAGGDLEISATGDISIGDASSDLYIGDGVNNVDIIFEQSGEIRGLTGVAITLGQADSSIQMGTNLNLNNKSITNIAGATFASGTVDFNTSATVNFNKAQGTSPFTVDSTTTVSNLSADLLDGVDSGGFLRSNTSDNYTSGTLTFNSGTTVSFANTTGTAPFTVASTTVVTNLNADLLDGQSGAYYLNYSNFTNTPSIPTVNNPTITISAGAGLVTGGSFTLNQSGAATITIDHEDTSTQASVNNSNGNVIQDVTLDTYGHVTGLVSIDLDGRYYTESEADTRFLNVAGDTMTGDLQIGNGTAQTRILIQKADNNVSDHIIFYNGTTRIGEIGVHDTWLRLNNETNTNIYTPRYIRADAGFFVDSTSTGINGTGNIIGINAITAAKQITSTLAAGTAPFVVASDTVVANLNADKLDGYDSTDFFRENLGEISNGATQDFNNFTASGSYYVVNWSDPADVVANGPTGSYAWGCLKVTQFNGPTFVLQEYWPHNTDISWSRVNWAGTWTAWRESWGSGNDGSGSGLDADLLDGQQGSYYLDWTNVTNKPTISNATITIVAGNALVTGGSFTLNQSSNASITIDHEDTSTQASVNNSGGTVIQDVTLDTYGHVTGLTSYNLDGRYYTETEIDTLLGSYTKRYTSTATIDANTYVTVATVVGDRLGSGVSLHVNGTSNGVVVAATAEIIVNHSGDILVNSISGNYTQLYIRIISDSNEDFSIQLKRTGETVNTTTVSVDIYTKNSETVTFTTTNPYSTTTHEHLTKPGAFLSASDAGAADFTVEDNFYVGSDRVFHDGYHPNADTWTTGRRLTLGGDVSGSVVINGSANVTLTVAVSDDSHNHTIANVDGLQTALDGKLGTTAKAADSDKLDNLNSTDFTRYVAAGTLTGTSHVADLAFVANYVDASNVDHIWHDDSANIWTFNSDSTFKNTNASSIVAAATFREGGTDLSGKYVQKNTGYTWTGTGANALSFQSLDAIDTASGDQAALEVYQDTAGADAFMQFHVAGDYAKYFGLHGGINDFVIGGWSYGAAYQRIFHDGYHPNADTWTTARTLTLDGDVSGSASIDGSANQTLTVTLGATNSPVRATEIAGSVDLDTLAQVTDAGFYYQAANADAVSGSNYPADIAGSLLVQRNAGSGGYGSTQLYIGYTDEQMYVRSMYGSGATNKAWTQIFTDKYHPNADTWTTGRRLTLSGDVSGNVVIDGSANATMSVSVSNDSHFHTYLQAVDDRDVKPNTSGVGSGVLGMRAFFTSYEGMTGSAGTNYQDLLVLDTYSDTSGGNANAITIDKSDGIMRLWNAVHSATSWGTPRTVMTDDSTQRRLFRSANSGATSNQYGKVARVTLPSQYNDYQVTGALHSTSEGIGEAQSELFEFGVKQQSAFGTNPLVNLDQFAFNGSYAELGYVIVQNTPNTIVDLYVKITSGYAVIEAYAIVESSLNRVEYYDAQTLTTTQPSGYVAATKERFFHTGYHPNADKWTTARTLTLTGDVTGSASIDGSGNVSLATTAAGISGFLSDSGDTSTGMLVCHTTLTNNNDYLNSPISIRERAAAGAGDGEDRDSPNLNFHWGGRVSNSLWMGSNSYLNWGSYSAAGIPNYTGVFRTTTFAVGNDALLKDINVADTLRVEGQQNANNGYITFGNVSNTALGRAGSGDLTWGGVKVLTGNVTGTLFADVIAANEIYADMIAANAITAQKIQANAITANKIAADSVTANELQISSSASVANSIFFDGSNKRIDIKDASGVLRVRIGQL